MRFRRPADAKFHVEIATAGTTTAANTAKWIGVETLPSGKNAESCGLRQVDAHGAGRKTDALKTAPFFVVGPLKMRIAG